MTIIRAGKRKKAHIVTEWGAARDLYRSPCGLGWGGRRVAMIASGKYPYEHVIRYDDPDEAAEAIDNAIRDGIMCSTCIRNTVA